MSLLDRNITPYFGSLWDKKLKFDFEFNYGTFCVPQNIIWYMVQYVTKRYEYHNNGTSGKAGRTLTN